MDIATERETRYVAFPFTPTPERFEVVSAIMRGVCEFDTVFNDYCKPCDSACGSCEACVVARATVAAMLAAPDTRTWEVWREGELVGVLYLTKIVPGVDAKAHYVFFDRKLVDKTELLREMIEWVFSDHSDWKALRRLTVEVPTFAYSVVRHAVRKLGFGGDFAWRANGRSLPIEGIRRGALKWRGADVSMLMLGRVNDGN